MRKVVASNTELVLYRIRTAYLPECYFDISELPVDVQSLRLHCPEIDLEQKYVIHKTFTKKKLSQHMENDFNTFQFIDVSDQINPTLVVPKLVFSRLSKIFGEILRADSSRAEVTVNIDRTDVLILPTISAILLEVEANYCFSYLLVSICILL
jgi:hypothetical protein